MISFYVNEFFSGNPYVLRLDAQSFQELKVVLNSHHIYHNEDILSKMFDSVATGNPGEHKEVVWGKTLIVIAKGRILTPIDYVDTASFLDKVLRPLYEQAGDREQIVIRAASAEVVGLFVASVEQCPANNVFRALNVADVQYGMKRIMDRQLTDRSTELSVWADVE